MVSFSIDRGGTFTDIYAFYKKKVYIKKLLSSDPLNYEDAPSEGIRRILKEIFNIEDEKIDPSYIKWIRMGTTVATNALLERKGAKCAFVTTKGFRDSLKIGYQNRPKLFELNIKKPSVLYEKSLEIDERVIIKNKKFKVQKAPDKKKIKKELKKLKKSGIDSLAVALLHSYSFDKHEKIIKKTAKEAGFKNISLSSEVIPSVKLIDRADTTVIDAYLTPHIKEYISSFKKAFSSPLEKEKLLFMQSHGGLCEAENFRGANALLSGPAGGITGYAKIFEKFKKPLIGFDMGGTSTDISRYDGEISLSYENEIDSIRVKTPQIEILTTAAGGGSRLFYKNSLFVVGPESSGANPGPVCYKKGGYLSITDANLILGRIQKDFFPEIFGKKQNEPLGFDEAREAFLELTKEINSQSGKNLTVEEVALGFVEVANENMIKPIKEISIAKGYDIREHILCPFGGAGGQHACAVARKLGIKEIYIHRHAGILSAVGLNNAKISKQQIKTLNIDLKKLKKSFLKKEIKKIATKIIKELNPSTKPKIKSSLNLRYKNVENLIKISAKEDSYKKVFEREHKREFGFVMKDKEIEVAEVIVDVVLENETTEDIREKPSKKKPKPKAYKDVYFEKGWIKTPFYLLDDISPKSSLKAPAVIINDTSTLVIEPHSKIFVDEYKNIKIELLDIEQKRYTTKYDPILLSVFNTLFISTAEQMGKMFQKTAVSTNIKERLDFSCALFDKEGNLIANAPHIPVHLGSMSYAVKKVLKKFEGKIKPKESFITNAPYEGGSHLPDITVITPYIVDGEVAFVTANRGHHADIGGKSAGSMPPFSTSIKEEGAVIEAMKIVEDGRFLEKEIREIFKKAKARKTDENISDIKAALSANQKGISLMKEIWQKYSKDVTDAYMEYIQNISKKAVGKLLDKMITKRLRAFDYLDDGSRIEVEIFKKGKKTVFDFTKSSIESFTNQNTPFSVTASAIVYVLRTLLKEDLPLNQGFLRPIKIKTAKNSLLNPDKKAAVVGGNVTTSQRITDVVLKAFGLCGASQGCMNNFSFGDKSFGYYETIGGGSGATKGHDGADGVHTHMTNTRITDTEVVEERYPVVVRRFQIRKNSGGKGKYRGGNGIVREMEFLKNLQVTLLTERRVFSPWGAKGGKNGKRGKNILIRNGKKRRLPPKVSLKVKKGDRIVIYTPGGGGYGR